MAVYLTALALLIIYVVSAAVFDEPNQRQILAIIDPFGINTFSEVTSYWTPFDKNTMTVQLTQEVLIIEFFGLVLEWLAYLVSVNYCRR